MQMKTPCLQGKACFQDTALLSFIFTHYGIKCHMLLHLSDWVFRLKLFRTLLLTSVCGVGPFGIH